jgi:hypothetical protein
MCSWLNREIRRTCRLAGGELALIIGRMARRLSEEEAMDYVAGIAIGQDFAERDWETNESRWLYGKAYDAPIALGNVSTMMRNPAGNSVSHNRQVDVMGAIGRPGAPETRECQGH